MVFASSNLEQPTHGATLEDDEGRKDLVGINDESRLDDTGDKKCHAYGSYKSAVPNDGAPKGFA
jgi:hypothetical protein